MNNPSATSPPPAETRGTRRRILLVCRSLPCHVQGGIEYHVLDLASGLRQLGHEVGLLSTPIPEHYRKELAARRLQFHEVSGVSPGVYTRAYFRDVGEAIDRAIEAEGYDVIHGQEFGWGLWKGPASPVVKRVLTVHGTLTSETALHRDLFQLLSPAGRLRALRRYGRRLFFVPIWHRMLDRADRILVDSEFTRGELLRIRPRTGPRIRHVPLGVDMSRYPELSRESARDALGWASDAPLQMITVGRLEWQKGHDLSIRALAALKDLDWTYWIVGEGGHEGELRKLVCEYGLEDRIRLTGRVDAGTKSRMLGASDLFIWPERTHPAFGLVGLESMLMNTPVLGARRGAILELIDEESGWTFEPESVEALSSRLESVLTEPQILQPLSEGLRDRTLKRFEPGAMAQATLCVYEELFKT